MRRATIGDAAEMLQLLELGADPHQHPGKQAFYDLRQTLPHFGRMHDQGLQKVVLQDKALSSTIAIRVYGRRLLCHVKPQSSLFVYFQILEVRKVAAQTPLILVLYCHDLKGYFPMRTLGWTENALQSGNLHARDASLEEQHLLLRLLDRNSNHLPASLQRRRERGTERSFTLSFLLPVRPLSNDCRDAIGVEAPESCAVCGKETKSHCSGCRAIRYCSPGKSWSLKSYPRKTYILIAAA